VVKPLLAASAASLALAGAASAAGGLPVGWTHASINVVVNHAPHTLVLDRGRVTAVTPTSLTLREADGNSVQVGLASTTQVIVDGRPGQLSDLRRGEFARTEAIDGGPARQVQVHVPPRLARLPRR
jgi:hypothetical protein